MNEDNLRYFRFASAMTAELYRFTDAKVRNNEARWKCSALKRFDLMLSQQFPQAKIISPEIGAAWIEVTESQKLAFETKYRWIALIRILAAFLNFKTCDRPHYEIQIKKRPPVPEFKDRLHSGLKELILDYFNAKRLAGHKFAMEGIFIGFDKMLCDEFPDAATVTGEIVLRWVEKSQDGSVSINTSIRKITPVRSFCKYLRSRGIECFVPDAGLPGKPIRYRAHDITGQELKAFFRSADSLKFCPSSPLRHITAPAVFRLLYSSGLRPSEALKLRTCDVDLTTGRIFIRESKAHAFRLIVVHSDMLGVLRAYDRVAESMSPGRKAFFIADAKGGSFKANRLNLWFHAIWDCLLPEALTAAPPKMTVRDFRHLYAVSVITRWYRNGEDVSAMQPYLTCSMGHQDFVMTSYYISLCKDFHPELIKVMEEDCRDMPSPDLMEQMLEQGNQQ